jgi:hypothetical protein
MRVWLCVWSVGSVTTAASDQRQRTVPVAAREVAAGEGAAAASDQRQRTVLRSGGTQSCGC